MHLLSAAWLLRQHLHVMSCATMALPADAWTLRHHFHDLLTHEVQVNACEVCTERLSACQEYYESVVAVSKTFSMAAGLRGFAGGNAARVLQLGAGAAVSWVTYEEVKLRLADMNI